MPHPPPSLPYVFISLILNSWALCHVTNKDRPAAMSVVPPAAPGVGQNGCGHGEEEKRRKRAMKEHLKRLSRNGFPHCERVS